jgi:hypothetical protein
VRVGVTRGVWRWRVLRRWLGLGLGAWGRFLEFCKTSLCEDSALLLLELRGFIGQAQVRYTDRRVVKDTFHHAAAAGRRSLRGKQDIILFYYQIVLVARGLALPQVMDAATREQLREFSARLLKTYVQVGNLA